MPVQGKNQVSQALVVDNTWYIFFVWQHNSFRARDAELRGKGCLEEFVVRCPHKGIIDYCHTLEDSILEVYPVIWHLLRNAVNNHCVGTRFIHACATQLSELGDNAFVAAVNFFHKSGRGRKIPPHKK